MSEDESMYMSETSHGTGQAALQMQQRMLRLRRDRDKRISQVVAETSQSLSVLKGRIEKRQSDTKRQKQQRQLEKLQQIISLAERRQNIEGKMTDVVTSLATALKETEEVMLAGYQGREDELLRDSSRSRT